MEKSCLDYQPSNEKAESIEKELKGMMSSLPRRKIWGASSFTLCQYQGFWCYSSLLERIVSVQNHFQPQPSEVILCSTPKSGTTWLKSLTFAIMTRSSFHDSDSPLLTNMPHDCVPFLEMDLPHPYPSSVPRNIPILATHIPYPSLPESIKDSDDCKIVYVCRDPKDTFVSWYHFTVKRRSEMKEDSPLEEAFERFCEGVSSYGPIWDHVLGFWRASLERPDKVLFLKYEEMKGDTVLHVKKLAEFIGHPFSLEEEENGMIDKIVKMCSFENLSNLEVNKSGKHRVGTGGMTENKLFFRKGKIGDWENHLTPEMAARIDHIVQQKLQGSGLTPL